MNEDAISEGKFLPKWENYDIMQARWKYIAPQTKCLIPEESILLPSCSHVDLVSVVGEDGRLSPLKGNFNDAEHYASVTRSISSRSSQRNR